MGMRSVPVKLQRRRAVCGSGPLRLPPQQLMVTAAALFVAAMIVSLVVVAGCVEPGEREATSLCDE